jgi:hypothetical protein
MLALARNFIHLGNEDLVKFSLRLLPHMGRPKKKLYKQPSIINSDLDHQFSAHESDSTDVLSDSSVTPTPSLISQKRSKPRSARQPQAQAPAAWITYAIAAFSALEMKKASRKRRAQNASL